MRHVFLLASTMGCSSTLEEPPTWDEVQPVLATTCAPCHIGNDRPSADFAIDRYEDVVGVVHSETGLALVEPFSAADSYLWLKIINEQASVPGGSGLPMPPLGSLSRSELDLIEAWIEAGALPGDSDSGGEPDRCPDSPACEDCLPGPASVSHAPWMARLTESPEVRWEPVPGAMSYEIAIGTESNPTSIACWTPTDAQDVHRFTALWGITEGSQYTASVRAVFDDEARSSATTSTGWTVDITPPEPPGWVDDHEAPVSGDVSWEGIAEDELSGFAHWEFRVGTAPGSGDITDWTEVSDLAETTLGDPNTLLPAETWYWLTVRSRDVAGNSSASVTSDGFIRCPEHFSFVPGDAALGSTPFCVSRYEMRMRSTDDGAGIPASDEVADARPTGTPWGNVDKNLARTMCDAMGFPDQLITNVQWQTVARSIERVSSNWSGGAVGSGMLNQGHSDREPAMVLSADGSPCMGTGNSACEDPTSADWSQKRTHTLDNGEQVWDLAGNLTEQVDGSTGGPSGLWNSYADANFTSNEGWEALRHSFAPAGPWDETHGMGMIYGGTGNLTRGGSYYHSNPGTGGSEGMLDTGIYNGNHNTWNTTDRVGFRCTFTPM